MSRPQKPVKSDIGWSTADRNSAAGLLLALFIPLCAIAQGYPAKPIRYFVPFPPGAFNDTLGRTIAQKFVETGFAQTVVDNRPGAGSTIGTELVAKAPADGYTLLGVAVPFAVNATLYARLPYDTLRDFTGVIYAGATPNMLVMHPSVPVGSIKELIALAKAKPNQLNYASTGNGTSNHMSMELFKLMTGTQIVQISYKAIQQAITDTMAGQIHVVCDNAPSILPHVRAGRLRALGVMTPKRNPYLPDIPTIAEGGVPGFDVVPIGGYVLPANTPRDIVLRLNSEINKALVSSLVSERFTAAGLTVEGGTPEQYAERLRLETAKWAGVIKAAGIKPE